MPVGYPSIRVQDSNPNHHLWNNNGTWWIHFTIHFGHRKRRIRRSLKTRSLADAIDRRDRVLAHAILIGEVVSDRRCPQTCCPTGAQECAS
jgi:hypothetical protein